MDHIDEYLATACQNIKCLKAIHAVLALRKQTLNHYYDKTDHSDVYRIGMGKSFHSFYVSIYFKSSPAVLHPHHKLHYFKKTGWKDSWIKTSLDIVHAEFNQTDALMDVNDEAQHCNCKAPRAMVCIFYSPQY